MIDGNDAEVCDTVHMQLTHINHIACKYIQYSQQGYCSGKNSQQRSVRNVRRYGWSLILNVHRVMPCGFRRFEASELCGCGGKAVKDFLLIKSTDETKKKYSIIQFIKSPAFPRSKKVLGSNLTVVFLCSLHVERLAGSVV